MKEKHRESSHHNLGNISFETSQFVDKTCGHPCEYANISYMLSLIFVEDFFFRGSTKISVWKCCLTQRGPVGGVFLLEVQYSILKSLISTCVLSYVGSREDWLLDRICES